LKHIWSKLRSLHADANTFFRLPEDGRIRLWAVASPAADNLLRARCQGGTLLDLGCGRPAARQARERGYQPGWYLGLDFDVDSQPDVAGDVRYLPLRDEAVPALLAASMLEHVYDYRQTIAEIYRVLQPGGCLLIQVPFLLEYHGFPEDYFRYTHVGLRRILEEAGFRVLVMDTEWSRGLFLNLSKFLEDSSFAFTRPSIRFILRISSRLLWHLRSLDRYYTGNMYQALAAVAEKPGPL